jgi:predicted small integral membrane protein
MVVTRLAKIAMIAAIAAYALIVAYDNVVDYQSNYDFVRHVLSMDTTFPGNALMHRAISSETIWKSAYALIIAIEGLTGLLLVLGASVLMRRLTAPARIFNRAKAWAIAGLTVGFGLWFFGFMVIAGEYFAMWQSKLWNGQESAFRTVTAILGVLIFVALPDDDLSP